MVKPITPTEAREKFLAGLPDFVIEAVNALLIKRGLDKETVIKQEEVVKEILMRGPAELKRADIFDNKYLDFEPAFRAAGWKVAFDKPAYCESYEAFWTFTRRGSR